MTYKVAVWGLGNHSIKNILPSIQEAKNLDLHGVFSRNLKTVQNCCQEFNCVSWESSDSMLKDLEVDIVFVSTPPGLHFNQGKEVLLAGKHFFCEKPITTNLPDLESLFELAAQRNLCVFEALMYIHHPHFKALEDCINKKVLGSIESLQCSFTLPKLSSPGFRFNPSMGGSAILDLGIYPLSIVINLFTNKKIEILSSSIQGMKNSSVDIGGEVRLRLEDGTLCDLDWSYDKTYKNQISIYGDKGSLFTEKIFSKDSYFIPNLEFDILGNKSNINTKPENHFKLMLELFSDIISNRAKLDFQIESTLNLSRLIQEVLNGNPLIKN